MELNIGKNIRRLRIEHGMTQDEVAEYAGVSCQAVSKWETNSTTPDIAILPRLAVFFGVRIDDLFGVTDVDELERVEYLLEHEKMTDENFAYAQKVLEKTLENQPDDVNALKLYARLYLSKNQRDRLTAKRLLKCAMDKDCGDAEVFSLYRQASGGDRNMFFSESENFIRDCEPYLEKSTDCVPLCELLISAMIDVHLTDRAEGLIERYKKILPTVMQKIFAGDIAMTKGNVEHAVEIWDSIDKNNHKGQYEIGERCLQIGDYTRAEAAFERSFASATCPRDLSAVYSLAFMYDKMGRREKSAEMWQRIIDVLKSDWGIVDGETVEWAKREREKAGNENPYSC